MDCNDTTDRVNIETPAGKPTHSDMRCAACGERFRWQWLRETRASGRVLVYPVLAEVGGLVQGKAVHACGKCQTAQSKEVA